MTFRTSTVLMIPARAWERKRHRLIFLPNRIKPVKSSSHYFIAFSLHSLHINSGFSVAGFCQEELTLESKHLMAHDAFYTQVSTFQGDSYTILSTFYNQETEEEIK